jgi:hypothetical protein
MRHSQREGAWSANTCSFRARLRAANLHMGELLIKQHAVSATIIPTWLMCAVPLSCESHPSHISRSFGPLYRLSDVWAGLGFWMSFAVFANRTVWSFTGFSMDTKRTCLRAGKK